ncbi:MAG: nucleoside hydrolase [Clostridiales bacterium]|nr:nucleoside hydrolase [Clostridiales bacterium]
MFERIFLDTDIGSDCDDAGAIALLQNLSKKGAAQIIGMTHCGSDIGGAVTIKAINSWFGRSDIPVGIYTKKTFLEEKHCKIFTEDIKQTYLEHNPMPSFEDAVSVMRRAIAENDNVTLVTIGMLNNIADLLRSEPDDISDKNGIELVKASVKCLYAMGGNFEDRSSAEYNIKTDIESARYVAENFPMPIVYCGFEVGRDVITSVDMTSSDKSCPVRVAYNVFSGKRESWDPITVYCAVCQENEFFKKQNNLHVSFDSEGHTVYTDGGKDSRIVLNCTEKAAAEEIVKYMKIS